MKRVILVLITVASLAPFLPATADELPEKPDKPVQKFESSIAASSVTQPAQRLSDVKKIFVASLGNSEGAEAVRQTIINRLISSGTIDITDSPEDADAVLTGAAQVNSGASFSAFGTANNPQGFGGTQYPTNSKSFFNASGGTNFSASIQVRLIGKTKQVLWTSETMQSGKFDTFLHGSDYSRVYDTANGAVSHVSGKVVKDLVKAINKDREVNQSTQHAALP